METKKFLIKEINGKFSAIKEGNKRATKTFSTLIEAGDWVHEQGAELIVEDRGCGCSDCGCEKDVDNYDSVAEAMRPGPEGWISVSNDNTDWESISRMTVPADEWNSGGTVIAEYYEILPTKKPTFIEKVKGLFSNMFN